MKIRGANAKDAASLAMLLGELGYPTAVAEVAARVARFEGQGNGRVLVAELGGQVIAFAALEMTFPLQHATPVCHISAFAVAEGARRQGIGRQLLLGAERLAQAAGCRRMVLTSHERRADAHAFYSAHGWADTGRRFIKELG